MINANGATLRSECSLNNWIRFRRERVGCEDEVVYGGDEEESGEKKIYEPAERPGLILEERGYCMQAR
jgi:hypothetical protein